MPTAGGLVGPPSAGTSIILDHSCGKLASGQLSTCHETVEPRWACHGSDRGELISNSHQVHRTPSVRLCDGTVIIGHHGCPKQTTGIPTGQNGPHSFFSDSHTHWFDWSKLRWRLVCRQDSRGALAVRAEKKSNFRMA